MENINNWVDITWNKIESKLEIVSKRNINKLPYTTTEGVYNDFSIVKPSWWTNGFWTGLMWNMFKDTKNPIYKTVGEKGEELLGKTFNSYDTLDHDLGFLFELSSVKNFSLTGNDDARKRAMFCANVLAGRFNLKGQYIRAWNRENAKGFTIIDSMMNLPLLYWASAETKDDRFKQIAVAHADTTIAQHIRADGSVKHIVDHDTETGEVCGEDGGQGYSVNSSWSRGQSWAIYGFALSYIHTKDEKYLNVAKQVANYFIAAICDDWLPRCDFRSPNEPKIYDSTAGAIAACGLIEISKNVGEFEKDMYLNAAIKILKALDENFCNWEKENDAIVYMGTEKYHSKDGQHISIIYGDYYFVEAVSLLRNLNK